MGNEVSTRSGVLTPTTFEGAVKFAKMMANSNMVPQSFKNKPEDVLVAIQWASEVGLPPMQALQGIAVINGKPAMYGDALLAMVVSHPDYGGHEEHLEKQDGDLVAVCTFTRIVKGREIVSKSQFSQADAVRAKLWKKAGPWTQYPKRMLQMRARGFALRDSFPDALKGIVSREEAEDMETGNLKDVTPENPLDKLSAPSEQKSAATESVSEQSLVSDDPIDQNVGDLPTDEPVDDTEQSEWEFILPSFNEEDTTEIASYPNPKGWCECFSIQMAEIANDEELTYEERRHNISVMKKANDDTIDRLKDEQPDLVDGVQKSYIKTIRKLSAQAKESANG